MNWTRKFNTFCFLDSHHYQPAAHKIECIAGAGTRRSIRGNGRKALDDLQIFIEEHPAWLFGHLGYDLKNVIEQLHSAHPDHIGFPELFFFEPEVIIRISPGSLTVDAEAPETVFDEIMQTMITPVENPSGIEIRNTLSREEYIGVIRQLKEHILQGDCYEINFCQEFFSVNAVIDPHSIYKKLSLVSPNPFSALYRVNDQWLICASPERFLARTGDTLLSQPIKGTSRRAKDTARDEASRKDLFSSAKDRSENVMVVDLVRNDLAKVCAEGSVQVDELYGIYTFPQVHQMISTVTGTVRKDVTFADIIKATFPMGSMTGAPKKRVMELIEKYEQTRRGIFSGATGYISPSGDFDFNVVIRSIMYNAGTKYLSFQAGSGITWHSDPETEWEECLLKAEAIIKVLSQ